MRTFPRCRRPHSAQEMAQEFGVSERAIATLLGAAQRRLASSISRTSCRKRQRLPSRLLTENVSGSEFTFSPQPSCVEAFPIKASDHPGARSFLKKGLEQDTC